MRGLILDYYQRHCDELHGVTYLQGALEDLDGRGISGALGAPIGPEQPVRWAHARERGFDEEQPFERGTIFLDSANGRLDGGSWGSGMVCHVVGRRCAESRAAAASARRCRLVIGASPAPHRRTPPVCPPAVP